ncbi:hypothetical protein JP28_09605 [Gallibacterium anatis]|nr:hypothetical protein JP28_09605 [Gallibacterium anatis]KGQ57711.1 hypothetical protein IO45_10685 [Gallibacterium anatis]
MPIVNNIVAPCGLARQSYKSPADFLMDLIVPIGKSFLGCGTGNVFPVLGEYQIWCDPLHLNSVQPMAFSSSIKSRECMLPPCRLNQG